ncbi:hypothetical protein [Halomicronema hongdechloris]|nr:hypothetical protein [Halomicronema hongdechloris]
MTDLLLILGRWLLTGEAMLTDGAVALQTDTILQVRAWEWLRQQYPHLEVICRHRLSIKTAP